MSRPQTQPTSFRLPAEVIDALDVGASRFGMSRTDWLTFLAKSAIADKTSQIVFNENEVIVRSRKCPLRER
jgi:hypothetical protein